MIKRILTIMIAIVLMSTTLIVIDIPLPVPISPVFRASGASITVDDSGGKDFTKIQYAIDNATNNDIIQVYSGTYIENIVVNKTVNLVATGGGDMIIDANYLGGHVVKVESDHVEINGFIIRNSQAGHTGIYLEQTADFTIIRNNKITNCYYGINTQVPDNLNIRDNNISSNDDSGLSLYGSSNSFVEDNEFRNNGNFGIHLKGQSNDNLIRNNSVKWSDAAGIFVDDSLNNSISGNEFISNFERGMRLEKITGNTIEDNTCNSNYNDGIDIRQSNNNQVNDNECIGNGHHNNNGQGIRLSLSNDNVFNDNTLNNNYNSGMRLGDWEGYSKNNKVENNTCTNNLERGIFVEMMNQSLIKNNNCSDNSNDGSHGIQLHKSSDNLIESNDIYSNGNNGGDGIYVNENSNGNHIVANTVVGNAGRGIGVDRSHNTTIRDNVCWNNDGTGIAVGNSEHPSNNSEIEWNTCNDNGGDGINIDGGVWTKITNNTCKDNNDGGIRLGGDSSWSYIKDNTCNRNGVHGLVLSNASQSWISNQVSRSNTWNGISVEDDSYYNSFHNIESENNGGKGIYIQESSSIQVSRSIFRDNEEGGIVVNEQDGDIGNSNLYIQHCELENRNQTNMNINRMRYCNISYNIIRNSSNRGIRAELVEFSNFTYNYILGNQEEGIRMDQGTNNNRIHHNFFQDNMPGRQEPQAADSSSTNKWDDGNGVGNYWSDYGDRYPDALSSGGKVWLTAYELKGINRKVVFDQHPICNLPDVGPIVNPVTGNYHWSIGAALDAAGDGDIISILIPGYYYEDELEMNNDNLLLNKTTDGIVIINGDGQSTGLTIKAAGCEVVGIDFENHSIGVEVVEEAQGFTIINSRMNNIGGWGFHLRGTSGVQLSDCYLFSPGRGYNAAMNIENSQDVLVNNCKIRNWGTGAKVLDSLNVRFNNDDFYNCGQALNLDHSSECTIENTFMEYCNSGIWLESDSSNNVIRGNYINNHNTSEVTSLDDDVNFGILISMASEGNVVEDNEVAECNLGISTVMWAVDNRVFNNTIHDCNLAGLAFWVSDLPNAGEHNLVYNNQVGIWINSSSHCDVVSNVVKNNEVGIRIQNESFEINMGDPDHDPPVLVENGSHDNVIKLNEISQNEVGIMANGGWNNYLVHNNLADNLEQTKLPEGSLICEMDDMRGNYWSDYRGRDDGTGGREAGDGFGDTDLPHEGIDHHPRLSPVEGPGYIGELMVFNDWTDRTNAYVGREFEFRIEIRDDKGNVPGETLLEFWYPNGMRFITPMDMDQTDNWTAVVVLENSVGELHYFVRTSPAGSEKWGYGPVWSLGMKDDMPPEILLLNIPEEVELGENLTFEFDVMDGAHLESITLEFWIGNHTHENVTFTPPGPYSHTIVTDTPGILRYIVRAADEFGNENATEEREILITKELVGEGYFGEDRTEVKATTGDDFWLSVELMNIEFLRKVNAIVEYQAGKPFHIEMDLRGDSNTTIELPSDATELRYFFEVIDVYDATHASFDPKEIQVLDNDVPILLDDMTGSEVKAPGELIFEMKVVDNIGVKSVKVEYWFDTGGNKLLSLSEFGGKNIFKSEAQTIDAKATGKLHYTISMEDHAGNINITGEIMLDIRADGGGDDDDSDGEEGSGTGGFFSSTGGILIAAVLVILVIVIIIVVIMKRRKKEEPARDDRVTPGEGAGDGATEPERSDDQGPEEMAPVPSVAGKGKKPKGKGKKAEVMKEKVPEDDEKEYEEEYEEDFEDEPDDWDDDTEEWSVDEELEELGLPPPPDDLLEALPALELEKVSPAIRNIIPGYIITDKLGAGGFATVYKAINKEGDPVAIKMPKFLDETIDSSVLNKFQAESDIWKKLKHKNIVTFLDSNIRPVPYMTIELMEGGNLGGLLKDHRLSVADAKPLMLQMLDGLSYAHRMASVHRDIKPENILFTKDGVPKIADWGIGKFMASESVSQSIGTKGTFLYSAPEQFDKETYGQVDWSTDIFQIGIVFYEMLTGKNPFKADELAAVMGLILTRTPDPPSKLNPEISPDLDEIILKCIEKRKEDRWRSTDVLYNQLKQMEKKRAVNIKKYSGMLKRALADGAISKDEGAMLAEFRDHMGISDREHESLVEEIRGG